MTEKVWLNYSLKNRTFEFCVNGWFDLITGRNLSVFGQDEKTGKGIIKASRFIRLYIMGFSVCLQFPFIRSKSTERNIEQGGNDPTDNSN